MTFTAQAAAIGVRAGRECVAPTAKRRPTRRTACTRFLPVPGSVTLQLPAGSTTLAFAGQLGVPLRQGRVYHLTLIGKDAAGNTSAPVSTKRFALAPPKRSKR